VRAPGDTPYLPTPGADPDPVVLTRQFARPSGPPSAPAGYELRDTLGGGGMGVVVLAREAAADRLVALKFVRAAADPAARDRFRVEVRAMARLDHPHVVRVLAVELDRPDPFFAMEYVPGVGLDRRILAGGPLPPAEAARVMEQVARAVQHAHAHGVVHRDLKPGNVVVGPGGVAKVTDFGLAKRVDAADGLTVYDAVLGTPGFMAPEQTGGRNAEVGPAADVYGLGATLYALLTGEPPFRGADPVAVAVRVRAEPPRPPSQLRPGVPAGLEAVALRCLAKDPAGRYPSAGDVADDLARWRRGERTHARPPSRAVRRAGAGYRRQRAAVMAALVPFVLLAISAMPVPVAPDPAVPARSALPPLDLAQKDLEANRGVVLIPPTGEPRFPAWM
jgi:serine/threonine protein kinase